MDDAELLAIYDRQIRRVPNVLPGFDSELINEPAPLLRVTPNRRDAGCRGGVFWSDLDESNVDVAIARMVEWFGSRGYDFEWKHHGYDRPVDLPERLAAAGFEAEAEEALIVGEISVVLERLAGAVPPDRVAIRRLRQDAAGAAADWERVNELHRAVWNEDGTEFNATLAAGFAADPEGASMWLAVADDGTVVAAGRVNFHGGTDFVSLWGGGTAEAFRGRGIYRALVARRAQEAAERGFRYLQVDALPSSRRILEPLGFRLLTSTTPWIWKP